PFGYRIRWYFTLNARELYHLVELRTVKQGHPDYRRMCQKMFMLAKAAHPMVFKNMKFVDMNDYEMQRDEAEKRIDRKMEEARKKYGE
ncbi:MAG TPA: FAD-dependent thymidylate synthase, partial [archaeon]|nr:FAD-dependent thymidylate synthase [archaeon]